MTFAAFVILVCIALTIEDTYGFRFAPSSKLSLPDDMPDVKMTMKKMSEMNTSLTAMKEQYQEMKTKSDQTEKVVEKMKRQMAGYEEKLRGTAKKMESIGKELNETTARLKKQCLKSDQMNSMLLGFVAVNDPVLLKFESAAMSSINKEQYNPSRAIDGNKNPSIRAGSCSHSNTSDHAPWWLGELSERSRIHRIELTNRRDCCRGRMNTISVEVFERDPRTDTDAEPQLCGKIDKDPQLLVKVECVQPVSGKYLRIFKHRQEPLQLCEVEAFGYANSKKFGMPVQSSEEASSRLAIDDDQTTCSETGNGPDKETWWQVEVPRNTTVSGVIITNRNDDKYTFLFDFNVTVHKTFPSVCEDSDDNVCTHHKGTVGQGETVTLTCDRPMTGRFLRITKVNGGMLSLCEVKLL